MKKTVFALAAISTLFVGTSCKRCMTCSYNSELQDPETLNFYESIIKSDEYCDDKESLKSFETEWNKRALRDSVSIDTAANCTVR